MLYIFDLGNVVIDIDFTRALGVWSNLSGVPLANLRQRFKIGQVFERYERGEIIDQEFARHQCEALDINLSYQQFTSGWQAIFIQLNRPVIEIMTHLASHGHRVVVLSNTNALHCQFWQDHYPEITAAAHRLYLSHQLGQRKPEPEIYQKVLAEEGYPAEQAVFFDGYQPNVEAAQALGITSVLVEDMQTIENWLAAEGYDR